MKKVLKGNTRFSCRVRPLLVDDAADAETKVVTFPTSIENLGRGVELMQQGQKHSFVFDKVFLHESSQQKVFLEVSQLVQSALICYKVIHDANYLITKYGTKNDMSLG